MFRKKIRGNYDALSIYNILPLLQLRRSRRRVRLDTARSPLLFPIRKRVLRRVHRVVRRVSVSFVFSATHLVKKLETRGSFGLQELSRILPKTVY